MASAELSRRVGRVVGYPPLCELGELQPREFHEANAQSVVWRCVAPLDLAPGDPHRHLAVVGDDQIVDLGAG